MNIETLIDDHLENKRNQETRDLGKFRASSFGRCYLAQVLKRRGEEETNPPGAKSLRIFNIGHMVHEYVQNLIPNKNEVCELEYQDEDFSGHCDYVGDTYVEDYKTVNVFKFNQIIKKGADVAEIVPNYVLQLMAYCKWWDKPTGRLTFINKDDWRIKSFDFQYSDYEDLLEDEFDILKAFWNKNRLPPAMPRIRYGRSEECIYCGYKDRCGK